MKTLSSFLLFALFWAMTLLNPSESVSQTCTQPGGITFSSITHTSARLNFTPSPGATLTQIQYRLLGMSTWSTVSTSSSQYYLYNLADSSVYEVELRSSCGANNYSTWTQTQTFTTLGTNGQCPPPTGISIVGTTNNSATITWQPQPGTITYYVYFKLSSASNWTYYTSSTNTVTLFNLNPLSSYDLKLRSYCSGFGQGAFSPVLSFSTSNQPASCNPPSNINASNISSNGATIVWSPEPGTQYYSLQYRQLGAGSWSMGSSSSTQYTLYNLIDSTQYEYQIRSYCGSSQYGAWSPVYSFTTLSGNGICPPPTGISVMGTTNNSASLSWNAASSGSYYYIYYKPSTSGNWTYSVSTGTSYNLFNLQPLTQYDFRIRTYCTGYGQGSFSPTYSFTTGNTASPCLPPGNVNVSNVGSNIATINWSLQTGTMYYQIQYRLLGNTNWTMSSSSATSLSLYNLVDSSNYEFQIRSNCGSNSIGPWSATYNFTTLSAGNNCPPPNGIAISSVSNSSATVSWQPGSGAQYYYVEYRAIGTTSWYTAYSNTTTRVISNLNDSTTYDVRVRAYCNGFGFGSYSPVSSFTTLSNPNTCPSPTGVQVSNVTSNGATISWTAVPGVMYYYIQYRELGSTQWLMSSSSTTSRILYNLSDTATYEFQLRSYCGSTGGYGPWSTSSTFTTLSAGASCPAPSGLTLTAVGNNWATLGWNLVPGVNYYYIYYRKSGTPTWLTQSSNSNSKTLFNLIDSTVYEYKIRSYCSPGGYGATSPVATFTTGSTPSPCLPPSGITAQSQSSSTANLSWTAVPGVMYYQIQYRESGASNWLLSSSSSTSRQLTNLFDSTVYEFSIRSYCGSNSYGAWSPLQTFTTLSGSAACPPPVSVSVSAISHSSAYIQWAPVSGVWYYQIYYRKASATAWSYTSVSQTQRLLSYLSDSSTYYFRIRSYCNTGGFGSFTPLDSFTTLSSASFVCQPPASIQVSNLSPHSAQLSWNPVPGAYHYRLQYRLQGSPTWTMVYTSVPGRTLLNLIDTATYEAEVSSYCGYNSYSSFGGNTLFTTPDDPNTAKRQAGSSNEEPSANLTNASTRNVVDVDDFSIYPNPAEDIISIVAGGNAYARVMIYNIQGVLVRTLSYDPGNSYTLQGLDAGIYFVRLSLGNEMSAARKLIIR